MDVKGLATYINFKKGAKFLLFHSLILVSIPKKVKHHVPIQFDQQYKLVQSPQRGNCKTYQKYKKKNFLSPGPPIIFLNINVKERLTNVNKKFQRQCLLNGYFLKEENKL